MSDEAGFLSRWARRKQAALRGEAPAELPAKAAEAPVVPPRAGPAMPPHAVPAMPTALLAEAPHSLMPQADPAGLTGQVMEPPAAGEAETPDAEADESPAAGAAEPFDVTSLPPVELLDASSDFSAFLKPGVPAALRSAALRKAWTADPLIRDYLSPLDYGWDFNAPGGLPFGFADTLGEGAGKVLQLIRQAVGEPEPPPEEGAPPLEPAPEAVPLEELPVAEPLMAESTEAIPSEAGIEAAEPLRRRHGGALPA
jgi:hypothetical protein